MSKDFRFNGNAERGYHVGHKVSTGNFGSLGHVQRDEDGTWKVRFTVPPKPAKPGEPQSCFWPKRGKESGFRSREEAAHFLRDEKRAQDKMSKGEYLKSRGLL